MSSFAPNCWLVAQLHAANKHTIANILFIASCPCCFLLVTTFPQTSPNVRIHRRQGSGRCTVVFVRPVRCGVGLCDPAPDPSLRDRSPAPGGELNGSGPVTKSWRTWVLANHPGFGRLSLGEKAGSRMGEVWARWQANAPNHPPQVALNYNR